MKKAMTIVYPEYNGLYINLTNKCPCNCSFCIRQGERNEFVFCGYGEPTEALAVLLEVADFLKANYSLPVRINTNSS